MPYSQTQAVDRLGTVFREGCGTKGDAKLNILQLGMGWFPEQPGGLDRYFFHLLRSLPPREIHARGLVVGSPDVANQSGGYVRAFAAPDASILCRCLRSRAAVRDEIQQRRPDLVASHFALYALPALTAIRGRRIPHVVHFHGPWHLESRQAGNRGISNLLKHTVERLVYQSAHLCIVLSRAFGELLAEHYRVAPERIRVIPGGVKTEQFALRQSRWGARQQLGWPTDRPILLSVRRLVQRMGLEELVLAMDSVREECPETLLLIAGRGPLATRLERRISDLALQNHVRLLGFLPDEDLAMALRAADFTVVPSIALEGFGLSAVESLAAGTPCLVSPVGGLPEVVRDLDPALIFSSAAAPQMADRIIAVLSGKVSLPCDEKCRAFAASRYDWKLVATKVSNVYRDAAEAN